MEKQQVRLIEEVVRIGILTFLFFSFFISFLSFICVFALQGKVLLAVVDVDACPEISEKLSVTAVPTVVLFHEGKAESNFQGVPSETVLRDFVARAASMGTKKE